MGLFDIFSNGDAQNAANAQINGLQSGFSSLKDFLGQGNSALTSGYTAGRGDLINGVNAGNSALTSNFGSALQPFLTNYNTANAGQTQLANALGLNGASGNAQATAAFQNNPGYQFQVQQATDAVNRNQAATGMLASGNTNVDLSNYISGLANTGWNQYLSQLQPFLGAANNAAGGVSNVFTGLGSALNSNATGLGSALNANSVGLGSGLNQNYGTLGSAGYGTAVGQGNAQASADLANYGASANLWGLLGGIGKMGVSGGGTVGGNLLNGAGSALMGFLSDERAKDDIEKVGELYDGQPVYRYRYKGDPRHQIGLIAQDVEKVEPDSVIPFGNLKGVNYKRATDVAADLGRFLEAA